MTVRRATELDIPRILELLVQVDMVHHEGRPDIFKGPATKYNAGELAEIIPDDSTPVFVCEDEDGTVMGHAFCIHKQVVGDSVLTDIKTLYIDDICVDSVYRGRGVGKALYEHVVKYAEEKGCYNITLNVWNCNPGAMRFYESLGLVPQKVCMEYVLSKEEKYEIRLAEEADRKEILALYNMQKGREYCPWPENYPSNETIAFDMKRDALFIMKESDRIVAAISIDEDEAVERLDCWTAELAPGGELSRLAVHPDMQGRGIARKMIVSAMEELRKRGFKSLHFLVNKYNVKALRSYAHLGFSNMGECSMYEQDFFCYEKKL